MFLFSLHKYSEGEEEFRSRTTCQLADTEGTITGGRWHTGCPWQREALRLLSEPFVLLPRLTSESENNKQCFIGFLWVLFSKELVINMVTFFSYTLDFSYSLWLLWLHYLKKYFVIFSQFFFCSIQLFYWNSPLIWRFLSQRPLSAHFNLKELQFQPCAQLSSWGFPFLLPSVKSIVFWIPHLKPFLIYALILWRHVLRRMVKGKILWVWKMSLICLSIWWMIWLTQNFELKMVFVFLIRNLKALLCCLLEMDSDSIAAQQTFQVVL